MTVVRPFRALRYDTSRVDLSRVMVPPYDVIADDEREGFYLRDVHSAIRLELTRTPSEEAATDYSQVARTLAAWRSEGVLRRDATPALYAMCQRFQAPDGRWLERLGFFAELALEDYSRRVVLPHERTLAGPKADRLKLLRATRANLSSIFLLYQDREQRLDAVLAEAFEGAPSELARDHRGLEYRMAPITDPELIETVQRFLASRPVVIADGHHRYETALAYRDECRQRSNAGGECAPFESILAFLANAHAPGNLLLPIHRVIAKAEIPTEAAWRERLPGWESKSIGLSGSDGIAALLEQHLAPLAGRPAFAADDGASALRLFWRSQSLGEELMVRIVEREVIGGVFGVSPEAVRTGAVSFPKSAERAAQQVRSGEGSVALYLNPLSPDDVFRVTGAGEVMPQKSTFFYPKIPTGLVFRTQEGET